MNELSRINKWIGGSIFIGLPLALTIFVWPDQLRFRLPTTPNPYTAP